MEEASREAFTLETKAWVFQSLGYSPSDWRDLGGFESFVYANADQKQILRITHKSHRTADDIQAELEFLRYLKAEGAPVCSPCQISGELLKEVGEFTCCLFEMAPGRVIQQPDWGPKLFRSWGAALGRFHKLSVDFQPVMPARFDWRTDANLDFRARIPEEQESLLLKGDRYLQRLKSLPVDSSVYGLIHSDAHAGNFFIDGTELRFFDFDDCCYQWYAFDIATVLFSAVLQPWMSDDQRDRETEARRFLPDFFKGYQAEYEVSDFLLEVLPLFLKVREFSLYAVIHSHMDVTNLTDWYPIKFMSGRQARLEADLPYLDIDFSSLG